MTGLLLTPRFRNFAIAALAVCVAATQLQAQVVYSQQPSAYQQQIPQPVAPQFSISAQPVMPSPPAFDPQPIQAPITYDYGSSSGPYSPLPAGGAWEWVFLPQGTLYHTYWASAAEPRLSTQLFRDFQGSTNLDSNIAGRLNIVRFGNRDAAEGWQLDLLGGAKLRQDADHALDVMGTDFRFDVPITYRNGPHALKFGYYHISAHTGDEFLVRHPGWQRLNWLRDAFYLGYSFYPNPDLRFYAEADWGFNTDINEPWAFQFGMDYGPSSPTGAYGQPFLALNVHLRQEVNFGGNFVIQGGWAWKGDHLGSGTLRTGPFYYNGKSPQFSFYDKFEHQLGWGLWYDF